MSRTALAAFLLFGLLLSACARNDPEAVAQQYWDAIITGDEEVARRLIAEGSEPSLSAVIEPGSGSRVEIGRVERSSYAGPTEGGGDTAEVPTTIHWVDGDESNTFQTETILVFEDGAWKVDPAATRAAFFESVYRSALTGLEAALEESADAFRELGSSLSENMARELSAASRELQQQAEQANEEIKKFVEELDEELQKEIERHRAQ